MVLMATLSVAAGFGANAVRSGRLPWSGSSEEGLRWPDLNWISAEEAAEHQGKVATLFLDARSAREYSRRHVATAVSLPADDIDAAYEQLRDFLQSDMQFIVYANEPNLSVRVFKFLEQREYEVKIIDGGWNAWERKRLPVERGG